jgi:hypothetical protein
MVQNISARRGAAIAGFATLALLALLAAFDNQWLRHWRMSQSSDNGSTAHSWSAGPIRGLSALAWRATKEAGQSGRVFFGAAAQPVIALVLTFLLLLLVCRGVGAQRGRWALFLGAWFATGLAAAAALIAGSAIAGAAITPGLAQSSGYAEFGRGDLYYALVTNGLAFGLFAGWLVGFVAVLVYGSTEGAADTDDTRTTQEYPTSSPDDYSFTPTSPYSSGPSYGGYESPTAPTEVMPLPPQENHPYGGGERSY